MRGLSYFVQSRVLNKIGRFVFALPTPPIEQDLGLQTDARNELFALIKRDADRFADGTYPKQAHDGLDFLRSWLRAPKVTFKSLAVFARRKKQDWSIETHDPLYPKYFQRSFHFQNNGYQSAESAALYEAQVELLFAGSASAMRRLAIIPLHAAIQSHKDPTRKFKVLEVACGTGAGTKILHAELLKSGVPFELWASDLSSEYVEHAKKTCSHLSSTNFFQADASRLPFESGTFDAVSATFLWHELPEEIRSRCLDECFRVTRQGGTFLTIESIQLGDVPKLDPLLGQFPKDFHEPFFTNYVKHPLEFNANLGTPDHKEIGFLSKCLAWKK